MSIYVQLTDVRSRVGGRDINDSSKPSEDEAQYMLDEAEGELLATLTAIGVGTPSTNGQLVIRNWVARYVSGLVRRSHAAAAGDADNQDGQTDIDWWLEQLERVRTHPTHFAALFSSGASPDASIDARSYITDNSDGLTIADGDFDPVITSSEVF